ncbi:MAG: ChaB family protein [Myxococcota bacterium]
MPYDRNADLPRSVRDHLPPRAQTLYRKAFNHAWDEYAPRGKRRKGATREETAHRVAWSAVKHSFERRGDRWVEIGSKE